LSFKDAVMLFRNYGFALACVTLLTIFSTSEGKADACKESMDAEGAHTLKRAKADIESMQKRLMLSGAAHSAASCENAKAEIVSRQEFSVLRNRTVQACRGQWTFGCEADCMRRSVSDARSRAEKLCAEAAEDRRKEAAERAQQQEQRQPQPQPQQSAPSVRTDRRPSQAEEEAAGEREDILGCAELSKKGKAWYLLKNICAIKIKVTVESESFGGLGLSQDQYELGSGSTVPISSPKDPEIFDVCQLGTRGC
jgi:hypothetical protein